jgi:YHS domain-containing protein
MLRLDKHAQWALVAAFWILVLGVLGIGWHAFVRQPAVVSGHAYQAGSGEAVLPQTAVCPVTGDTIRVSEATPMVRYQGKAYFFSTVHNAEGVSPRDLFLMNPASFAGDSSALQGP